MTKSNLLLSFLLFYVTLSAGGQAIVAPLDREVALAGEIREIHGYGPPGYGEDKNTDTPITYWVLELPNPINVPCTPEKPEWAADDCKATKRLKLFFPSLPTENGLERKAKAVKGHKVTVSGVLHRQDTAGEITPIYMNVTEIQPIHPPPKP
jgi:hypothetical protein